MSRTPNPNGDPVAVRKKGDVFKVRYYPTGTVTDPADRKELTGVFRSRAAAETQAARLRERLIEHREMHAPGTSRGFVRLSVVIEEYLSDQMREYEDATLPLGTLRKIQSDMRLYVSPVVKSRDLRISDLPGREAESVCLGVTQSGNVENTITASQWSLSHFGKWLVSHGYLEENPFTPFVSTTPEVTADRLRRRRSAANEQAASDTFRVESGTERGLGIEDVPSLELVSALSDAILRRESGMATVPNSRLRLLEPDVARQMAAMPLFRTATGLRHCETLAVHSSRVDLDRLTIGVDRQLLRLKDSWADLAAPKLAPPKHNRIRVAHVWPMFETRLRELVEWADENTGGWLFAPPRRDSWWTENCDDMWSRAIELMALEHEEGIAAGVEPPPPAWTWKPHFTRHVYGSYSLAPQSSGGLGWSIRMVSRSMGHANERTTEDIYRHAIGDELLTVRHATIDWPRLNS